MSAIKDNIHAVVSDLPPHVKLVAVSKFNPAESIEEAYSAGHRIFGESRVQELQEKKPILPDDIEWHFIGHLQPNKVKYIAPYVSLIHAVDSEKLLREIDKQGKKVGRRIPCLLQVHVAKEDTKFGFLPDELKHILSSCDWKSLSYAKISGMMCMATFTDDEEQIRQEFKTANSLFEEIKKAYFAEDADFCIKSWGMSDDYHIAIEEGSNMIRVGTRIFGARQY